MIEGTRKAALERLRLTRSNAKRIFGGHVKSGLQIPVVENPRALKMAYDLLSARRPGGETLVLSGVAPQDAQASRERIGYAKLVE